MRKRVQYISFLVATAIIMTAGVFYNNSHQAVETLSKYGSRGEEVRKIQQRLKDWGYDVGKVDGIYGKQTEKAVIQFQKNNNLRIDGIAGPETLAAIGLPTGSTSASTSANNNDLMLLARIINAEARGEPYEGQVAVGAVVLNRVKHPSFPNSLAGVIYQPGAFTAITDGQIHADIYDSAYRAAQDAMNGWDPSKGAIYYYNPAKTTNQWIYSRPVVTKIGKHVFAK